MSTTRCEFISSVESCHFWWSNFEISSNQESFDKAAPAYQHALENRGYNHQLRFEEKSTDQTRSEKKTRRRNITSYNPPFSKNVSTNVGKKFLNIVKQSFPNGHPLRKIFNKNTLKVSNSCMPNLDAKISAHNKSLLRKVPPTPEKLCNCRVKSNCPLDEKCLTENVIYQATVESEEGKETYIGLTGNTFKTRFRNHAASFRDINIRNTTELSKYIWCLNYRNIQFSLSWRMMARASVYSNKTKRCNLCTMEKYFILCKPGAGTLNKRNELASACRHAGKYLLAHS